MVGVPDKVRKPVGVLTTPDVTPPLKVSPGGTLPAIVQDEATLWVPSTLNAIVLAVPTAALAGLGVEALRVVAPASECTAPIAPSALATYLSNAVAGERSTTSPAVAATRSTGVRWSSSTNSAPGNCSHCMRRKTSADNFMVRLV